MKSICTAKCLVHYENLWTFELTYPRYIHSEFMTHRQFSRNASSSRAIPVKRMIEQVVNNPVIPPKVYMNKAGMVGDVEADTTDAEAFRDLWIYRTYCPGKKFCHTISYGSRTMYSRCRDCTGNHAAAIRYLDLSRIYSRCTYTI